MPRTRRNKITLSLFPVAREKAASQSNSNEEALAPEIFLGRHARLSTFLCEQTRRLATANGRETIISVCMLVET